MSCGVTLRTRLDAVVDLRERAKEKAERELADAQRELSQRRSQLDAAREVAREDHRAAGEVSHWLLVEAGHARALHLVRTQEARVLQSVRGEGAARVKVGFVQRQLEVVQRAADRKRSELRSAGEKAESKQLDQLASLLYSAR